MNYLGLEKSITNTRLGISKLMKRIIKYWVSNRFQIAVGVACCVPLALACWIGIHNNLSWCWTKGCIATFSDYFSPLITLVQFEIAILVGWAVVPQIRMARETLENSVTTSTFRDYLAHKTAFSELLDQFETKYFKNTQTEDLYILFFPLNSPRKFMPEPATASQAAQTIQSLIKDFNDVVDGLNELALKSDAYKNYCARPLCYHLSEFNRLRFNLNIHQADDINIDSEFKGFVNHFSSMPASPNQSIYNVGRLLTSLSKFCVLDTDKSENRIKTFRYNLNQNLAAYSQIVEGVTHASSDELRVFEEGRYAYLNGELPYSTYSALNFKHTIWLQGWNFEASKVA